MKIDDTGEMIYEEEQSIIKWFSPVLGLTN